MKLKVGDTVLVTGGKDRGRQGKVEKIFPKKDRCLVLGLNVYKRHRKGLGQEKGGILEFSRPLPLSLLALVCPNCQKATRVKYRILQSQGKKTKVRVCSKCNRIIKLEEKSTGKK